MQSLHQGGRRLHLSPLRYPGGKARLFRLFEALAKVNGLTATTYVEPYAGGAGSAINLLMTGVVERVVLNDLDPAVHAFWKAAVDCGTEMRELVRTTPVSVDEWHRQKHIASSGNAADLLSRGFATLFLNRTNRSGVLNAGPIGGLDQAGEYKIDARFNRPALDERLRLIHRYRSRITVLNLDGLEVVQKYAPERDCLIYADPPYFKKAGSLYLNSFTPDQHEGLAACLNQLNDARWVLTYDDDAAVHRLYAARRRFTISLRYSAYRATEAQEVMVVSDALNVDGVLCDPP